MMQLIKGLFMPLKQILQHIEGRRRWNRTRREMRDRAEGRLVVGLISSGALRLWK